MAAHPTPAVANTAGLYLGCHDPHGSSKTFASDGSSFSVSAVPPGAGTSLASMGQYTVDYPVVVGTFQRGGLDGWWDAAQLYRTWALKHWVKGYSKLLRAVRSSAGGDKVILTESNSEPFIGGIDLFLTLVGFSAGDLPPVSPDHSGSTIVPAFQAVYGGYVTPMGAEFFQQDFSPNPDVFAAKVAVQYVFGAQLGWLSLGGRDNQSPAMGVMDELMDHQYGPEVAYIKALSNHKTCAAEWFNHGRTMRPLTMTVNGTAAGEDSAHITAVEGHPRNAIRRNNGGRSVTREGNKEGHGGHKHAGGGGVNEDKQVRVGLSFGAVMSGTFLSADGSLLLVTATNVKRYTLAVVKAVLNMEQYGFNNASHLTFDVWTLHKKASSRSFWGHTQAARCRWSSSSACGR